MQRSPNTQSLSVPQPPHAPATQWLAGGEQSESDAHSAQPLAVQRPYLPEHDAARQAMHLPLEGSHAPKLAVQGAESSQVRQAPFTHSPAAHGRAASQGTGATH